MRSKLHTYKKFAHLPVSRVLRKLHVSEEELYNLIKIWIKQGKLPKNPPHFRELQKNRKKRINQRKYELNEENFMSYQYLRQEGHSVSEIAQILDRNEEKINKYGLRWYKELRGENLSFDQILEETNIPEDELKEIENIYEEQQREREKSTKHSLKMNKEASLELLKELKKELDHPENYLIIDLEGVQNPDEILEVAVIDFNGVTLMDTLVRPTHSIGWHVSQLTGINDEMASHGKGLFATMRQLRRITAGKTLLSWGTDYDQVLLNSAMKKTRIPLDCDFLCAQHIHMGFVGSPNQIALYKACGEDEQVHRALDDCHMVLQVLTDDIKKLEEQEKEDEC